MYIFPFGFIPVQNMAMNPLAIAGMFAVVLVLAYLWSKRSAPVATPLGGTAVAGSPSASTPIPPGGTIAAVAVATPVLPPSKPVKFIQIIKDTRSQDASTTGDNSGWRTFSVAEVYAYTTDRKLVSGDYSDAQLSTLWPGFVPRNAIDGDATTFTSTLPEDKVATLTLTLKNEAVITRVEVLNRQDCCNDRLAGAKLSLLDSTMNIVWSGVLTGAKDIQLFNISA